ncbi:DUF1345 domain-containing protein [Variovorax sp. J22G73]|jgi:uncharacterized membrane protein|uniref:DUF1345 domain-containing protein n=1 Tax=unclassified Variovorax TaxID=663243 RepID=UPI000D5C4E6A|nr:MULTISPECIES: DUF1345 domain-containing protein [unclassified Variovorax]MDM0009737.1 DUF1345 domain-containing protein [Variovorax sp. J22R203]MDM0102245.1 DUF1345 domain-containing protein [Variovorax sp. J22G73]
MLRHLSTTTGRQRLLYGGIAAAATAAALMPVPLSSMARGLAGWCVGVLVYQVLTWWLADTFDARRTRERAQQLDQPNIVILVSMLVVVAVSVVAIAMMLQQVKQLSGWERAAHVALGLVALAGSWLMMHTIYAFHYAHRYYIDQKGGTPDGGLDFPGKDDAPEYFDFLYYSFVIGMTSQVSDVQATSKEMRRITLFHSVLAFAFNMLVLALSVNVVAGAI